MVEDGDDAAVAFADWSFRVELETYVNVRIETRLDGIKAHVPLADPSMALSTGWTAAKAVTPSAKPAKMVERRIEQVSRWCSV
jgi:hypothetical protein